MNQRFCPFARKRLGKSSRCEERLERGLSVELCAPLGIDASEGSDAHQSIPVEAGNLFGGSFGLHDEHHASIREGSTGVNSSGAFGLRFDFWLLRTNGQRVTWRWRSRKNVKKLEPHSLSLGREQRIIPVWTFWAYEWEKTPVKYNSTFNGTDGNNQNRWGAPGHSVITGVPHTTQLHCAAVSAARPMRM